MPPRSALLAALALSLAACGGARARTRREGARARRRVPRGGLPAHRRRPSARATRRSRTASGSKQILVKYAGSKNAPASITRSREDACLRAMEARDKLRGGADWDAVVKDYSDEAGAATRGGLVGRVERGELVPSVADAAFELDMSTLSDVVESPFGFHLVFRTE